MPLHLVCAVRAQRVLNPTSQGLAWPTALCCTGVRMCCQVIENIGDVCRVAVPMALYFAITWFSVFFFFYRAG